MTNEFHLKTGRFWYVTGPWILFKTSVLVLSGVLSLVDASLLQGGRRSQVSSLGLCWHMVGVSPFLLGGVVVLTPQCASRKLSWVGLGVPPPCSPHGLYYECVGWCLALLLLAGGANPESP